MYMNNVRMNYIQAGLKAIHGAFQDKFKACQHGLRPSGLHNEGKLLFVNYLSSRIGTPVTNFCGKSSFIPGKGKVMENKKPVYAITKSTVSRKANDFL